MFNSLGGSSGGEMTDAELLFGKEGKAIEPFSALPLKSMSDLLSFEDSNTGDWAILSETKDTLDSNAPELLSLLDVSPDNFLFSLEASWNTSSSSSSSSST